MRKVEKVSSGQMMVLFFSFMLGSSIINIPQPLVHAAMNGAWLSVIIANGVGMLLLVCIFYLNRKNPNMNLIDYSYKVLGKWLTLCISVPIIILLFIDLSFIVIDIGGFLTTSMMRETPPYVFHFLILLVAAFTARAGIEVMARMFVLLLCYIIFFSLAVLILSFPHYQVVNLFPVFPEGLKPVIHGTYMMIGFPYGEIVLFSFILPFVQKDKGNPLEKYMFSVLLIYVFLLILSILCSIMALGPLAGSLKFSLFQLARLINIREIITRIESFIGIALIVGSYMKTTIMLFILKETLVRVLKLKDNRMMIFPVTYISFLLTLTMFESEIKFGESVFVVLPLFTMVVAIFPLLFVTVVVFFKGKKIKSNDNS